MRLRNIFWLLALIPCLVAGPGGALAAPKPILVHYMPWYASQPFSGNWGWHWTMNHLNPNTVNPNGTQAIASWYYPLIGPYDSADPAVLEYHVLLMKLAGIDGVVVDWYGPDNFNDYAMNNQRTLALFNYTRKAGLKFSLCYEDQTIQQEISGNFLAPGAALAHAQQTLLYAQTNFFTDPSFLRLSNAPVFFDFGPQYFKNSADWAAIFSVLDASNAPSFFTEDNRLGSALGAFDWPPMWLTGGGTNVLSPAQLQSYLVRFEQTARGWPAFVSSAFPRFHDIYAQAGASPSYGFLDDAGGTTLIRTLSRALTNNSSLVHIVTWNDFGEGTIVEPTRDYGYRDLGIIQSLRRQYLDPAFAYHTNDLVLAFQFYHARKQSANDPAGNAELDRIFTNIIAGNLALANSQLARIGSNRPATVRPAAAGGALQSSLGGQPRPEISASRPANFTWPGAHGLDSGTNLSVFNGGATQVVYQAFQGQ